MNASKQRPELWSEFDGTAFKKYGVADPRQWFDRPARPVPRYGEFLQGVIGANVTVAGILSRRADSYEQRLGANKSLADAGLLAYYGSNQPVRLVGSDEAKGQILAQESQKTTVGLVDDRPHEIGIIVVKELMDTAKQANELGIEPTIIIGAVYGSDTDRSVARLYEEADKLRGNVTVLDYGDNIGFDIEGVGYRVEVALLAPFSSMAGRDFAARLTAATE